MKISLVILVYFITIGLALGQSRNSEEDRMSPTSEESFYNGDQVNPEAFSEDILSPEMEQEESFPYNPHEEIYPYEGNDFEGEEEFNTGESF